MTKPTRKTATARRTQASKGRGATLVATPIPTPPLSTLNDIASSRLAELFAQLSGNAITGLFVVATFEGGRVLTIGEWSSGGPDLLLNTELLRDRVKERVLAGVAATAQNQ